MAFIRDPRTGVVTEIDDFTGKPVGTPTFPGTKTSVPQASPPSIVETMKQLIDPEQFRGTFRKGAERLFQPGEKTPGFEQFLTSGTQELADAFVDRYFEKTGELPGNQLVEDFVAQNLTSSFAAGIIEGTQPRRQTQLNIVDPFLEERGIGRADVSTAIGESGRAAQEKLSEILGSLVPIGAERVRTAFAPTIAREIKSEAARGSRLGSPISRSPFGGIAQAKTRESQALSDVVNNLIAQEAAGTVDLFKFGESLSEAERRAQELQSRFGRTLGLEREKFETEQDRFAQQLKLSEVLGRLMGQQKRKKSPFGAALKGIGTGILTGASLAAIPATGGASGAAISPLIAGISGAGSGLLAGLGEGL